MIQLLRLELRNGRATNVVDDLLWQLFPSPPGAPLNLHSAHVMCGVFSARQANAASKSLGFARADDGRRIMQQLRLLCIDGVHKLFHALKTALP